MAFSGTARYRADIFTAGTTSYSTSAVEFSLTLADAPTINGPLVRPFEGRSEGRPWVLRAVDVAGSFTAQLAGSDGRTDLINRVIQVRRSLNNGTYTVIGGGRVRDVSMGEQVAEYDVSVEQEMGIDANALIFATSNTTRLFPPSPHFTYGPFQPFPKGQVRVAGFVTPGYPSVGSVPKMFYLRFAGSTSGIATVPVPLTDLGMEAIRKDVKPLTSPNDALGNFVHLRLRVGNSTYPVVSFGRISNPLFSNPGGQKPDPNVLGELEEDYTNGKPPGLWVVTPTSTTFVVGQSYSSAFLHMFSAPPSEATPLHITTIHPMTLKRQLHAGAYASTDQPKARYSTAAFNDGSSGLERRPMSLVRFRITGPARRREWIERNLNAPFGVCDFTDSSGVIRPRYVWMPQSTAGYAFTFTPANLREPHPSWLQPGREMVTELRVVSQDEQWVIGGLAPALVAAYQRPVNASADFIKATPSTDVRQHDRIAKLGVQSLSLESAGVHAGVRSPVGFPTEPDPNLNALLTNASKETFDRYGDGPVQGVLYALSTAESVQEGDNVRITVPTFPNAGIQARGGTRLVQIMGRRITPYGPEFDYLDAGPNLNALVAPTVTLSLSTVDKKHIVTAVVASVPAGAQFQMDAAVGSTLPSSTSTLWQRIQTTAFGNGTYQIRGRPAGGKTWARVRSAQAQRVRSTWRNSTAGVTSSGLAAPVVATSSVTALSFNLRLSGGETLYPIQVFVDGSTAAAFSTGNLLRTVPAGTKSVPVFGLNSTTKYLVGARHIDPFGGIGASDSTTVTTLTTGTDRCRAPVGFYLIAGTT